MLKEELNKIKVGGMEYPIHCGLLALEKIQDEFGTLENFEKRLIPVLKKDENSYIPDVHAVTCGALCMINEGIEIWNKKTQMDRIQPVGKEIFLEADPAIIEFANEIHNEFMRCFESKKEETK